jgi:hypothetical protein
MLYGALILLLLGTESRSLLCPSAGGEMPNITYEERYYLLGCCGGVLARALLWLDRLVKGVTRGPSLAPLGDGIVGIIAGVCGVLLVAAGAELIGHPASELGDVTAALAGIGGGALGAGVLELVVKWFRGRTPTGK